MSTVTKVKDQVGEVLLGTSEEPQLSQLTRAAFMKHAVKDGATGDYYLGENEFINAVAPESEDYVNTHPCRPVERSRERDRERER